jgi:Raf kinase inhibitor-like YbhB/YbcL family protein
MKLTSTAFAEGAPIPSQYTCDGRDVSPPLSWTDVPSGTRALALVCDDPDAPAGVWVHWVVYDLPASASGLPEGVPPRPEIEGGGLQGRNDFRKIGWGGPCPPSGTHRYVFTLSALDASTGLAAGVRKAELLAAIEGRVLTRATLTGTYRRR